MLDRLALFLSILAPLALVHGALSAQTSKPRLVRDINSLPLPNPPSYPQDFTRVGGLSFFSAQHRNYGRELWRTNGQPGGTQIVKDIRPGVLSSGPSALTAIGTRLVFVAEGEAGVAVWTSDGTASGTKPIMPLHQSLYRYFVRFGGRLWFDGGSSIFSTDGTVAGTKPLLDQNGKRVSGGALNLASGRLFFVRSRGPFQGNDLWVSDGTARGTKLVRAFARGEGPQQLRASSGYLFFTAFTKSTGWELWRSDGTSAGTQLVKDIEPGPKDSFVVSFKQLGRIVIFTAYVGGRQEIWRSDGTDRGTFRLSGYVAMLETAVLGSRLFAALHGGALWRTDGTVAGTGVLLSTPASALAIVGPELWFEARGAVFRSDGTLKGTHLVRRDLVVRTIGPAPQSGALLSANGDDAHFELWQSNGQASGTRRIADINPVPAGYSNGSEIGEIYDGLGLAWFAANDGVHGSEPWVSDGTAAGTYMLGDLAKGPGGSAPSNFTEISDRMVFTTAQPAQVWVSDGSTSGTRRLAALSPLPGTALFGSTGFWRFRDRVLFVAVDGQQNVGLWETRGSPTTTRLVSVLRANATGLLHAGQQIDDSVVVFAIGVGREHWLYASDGTSRGTRRLARFVGWPRRFFRAGRRLVFVADDGKTGNELWSTDGTVAGTRLVRDVWPGPRGALWPMGSLGSFILAWGGNDKLSGWWRSDGTPSGTRFVAPGTHGGGVMVTVAGRLLFNGQHSQLWQSDGTAAGTRRLKTIPNGGVAGDLGRLVGSRFAYFGVRRPYYELWRTDGTASGTQFVTKIANRMPNFPPRPAGLSRGLLYFRHDDGKRGAELWVLDPGATAQSIGYGCGVASRVPKITASDPVLGRRANVRGTNAPAGSLAALLCSARPRSPAPLGYGCTSYVSTGSFAILSAFAVRQSTWMQSTPLPNDPRLLGARSVVQTWFFATKSALGLESSNAVLWTLGR